MYKLWKEILRGSVLLNDRIGYYLAVRLLKAFSTTFLSGEAVNWLTTGTIISETIIAKAPALIGESRLNGQFNPATEALKSAKALILRLKRSICATLIPTPVQKLAQQAALEAFFMKSP